MTPKQERELPAPEGASEKKPFLLRLPPELMEELRGWAAQELRSLNGHLEYLLRQAVKERRRRDRSG
jgi:hypothetical protein